MQAVCAYLCRRDGPASIGRLLWYRVVFITWISACVVHYRLFSMGGTPALSGVVFPPLFVEGIDSFVSF